MWKFELNAEKDVAFGVENKITYDPISGLTHFRPQSKEYFALR